MSGLVTLRLLELAPSYFDIGSFLCGETKRVVSRLLNKSGKAEDRCPKTLNQTDEKRQVKDEDEPAIRVQHPLSLGHLLSVTIQLQLCRRT